MKYIGSFRAAECGCRCFLAEASLAGNNVSACTRLRASIGSLLKPPGAVRRTCDKYGVTLVGTSLYAVGVGGGDVGGGRARPPQGQEPLAPVAQLRRLIVIFSTAVEAVGRNARVRVGLAEGEEVDPRLERSDLCGKQPVFRVHSSLSHFSAMTVAAGTRRKFDFHTGVDVVRRAVGEGTVRVTRAGLGREVVVSLHVRVYYERAGLRGDGDVQVGEPELATLVRII